MAIARCYLTLGGTQGCTLPGGHEGICHNPDPPKESLFKVMVVFLADKASVEKTYSVLPNIGDRIWVGKDSWRVACRNFSDDGKEITLLVEQSKWRYDIW